MAESNGEFGPPERMDSPSSYAAGWNDAKAGRQYGEGRHGPRVGARRHPVCLGMADGMCTRFADGGAWCPDGECEEQGQSGATEDER